MKDIGLEQVGELLDGKLEDTESIQLDSRIRVIGQSATDILFAYNGTATITGRTGPTYEGNEDNEYVLSGKDTTFIFEPDTSEYRASRPATHISKGYDERLTVRLTTPADHRLIIEDCDTIQY